MNTSFSKFYTTHILHWLILESSFLKISYSHLQAPMKFAANEQVDSQGIIRTTSLVTMGWEEGGDFWCSKNHLQNIEAYFFLNINNIKLILCYNYTSI